MKPRVAPALGVLLVLVTLLVLAGPQRRGGTPDGTVAADPYTRTVNRFFINPSQPPPLLVATATNEPGVPVVDLSPAARGTAALEFAVKSRLRADILSNDPSIWMIRSGLVTGIAPNRFDDALPSVVSRRWTGAVLYRRAAVAAGGPLLLDPAGGGASPLALVETPLLLTGDTVSYAVGGRQPPPAPAIDVRCGAQQRDVVRLRRVGNQVTVTVLDDSCAVTVDGRTLDYGRVVPLAEGGRLMLTGRSERFGFFRRRSSDDGAALSVLAASGQRIRDEAAKPWATAVDQDYSHAVLRGDVDPGALRNPLTTSLDPELQPAIQCLLSAMLAQLEAEQPLPPDRPRTAAVTLMDARTGEVLAMASSQGRCPALATRNPNQAIAGRPPRDPNLQPMPIGSAAKPLLAAAILADRRSVAGVEQMLGLRVPGKPGDVTRLLGMPVQRFKGDSTTTEAVDFNHFIQWSDNNSAAALLLLASPDLDPSQQVRMDAGDGYALCPPGGGCTTFTTRTKSIFEARDNFRNIGSAGQRPSWIETLGQMFDANTASPGKPMSRSDDIQRCGAGRYGDDIHEVCVWRTVLDDRARGLDAVAFRASSPEREALGLDRARSFRTEYLQVMLGNGEGKWSAVKLAEAYARLATGRRVRASFVHDPKAPPPPPLSLGPGWDRVGRQALTHAMTLVTEGTARKTQLQPALESAARAALENGRVLGWFAKTGTQTVATSELLAVDKAINLLISARRIVYDPAQRFAVLSESLADPSAREKLDRFGVTATAVGQRLAELNALELRDGSGFDFASGQLVSVAPAREIVEGRTSANNTGKVLAIVVAAYRSDSPGLERAGNHVANAMAQPERAYSLVVNFNFPIRQGTGANRAADLAGQIVSTELARRLVIQEQ